MLIKIPSRKQVSFWQLWIIMAFICTIKTYSQQKDKEHYISFSAAFDIKDALVGSDATSQKPALDILYQFSMVGDNIEVNIGYENYNAICFDKYTIGIGYHFPLYGRLGNTVIKTILIPSIEPTLIGRWGSEWETTSSHLSIGGNIALRWNLNDNISMEWLCNALPRTDLMARYPELHASVPINISNYLKIVYKIQR